MLPFYCCWCCYYTTGRAYAGQNFPVGVASCCRFFYCCWCCYYTTGRAYAGQIFPVGVASCCRFFFYCCWCYYTTARVDAAQIFAVGVRVALPFLLLVLLHYGEGKRCSNFRRWCTRCVAVFTAFGGPFTLPRG